VTSRSAEIEAAVRRLIALIEEQHGDGDPAHEDFSKWGWALGESAYWLGALCGVSHRQIYQHSHHFRHVLRDDEGGDPKARVKAMRDALEILGSQFNRASISGFRIHVLANHLRLDPEATP
jgi:hypothetical protein